jgi:tetratricopeptide (TPR) repeat protein
MKGDAHYYQENWEEAIKAYDKVFEFGPARGSIYMHKAESHFQLGENDEALKICDYLLEDDPECLDAWELKGSVLYSMGRTEEAHDCWHRAGEISNFGSAVL